MPYYHQENPIIKKFLAHSRCLISDLFSFLLLPHFPCSYRKRMSNITPLDLEGLKGEIEREDLRPKIASIFEVMARANTHPF